MRQRGAHRPASRAFAAGITNDLEILAAAVLHDILEDTPTQLTEIEVMFGKRVAELVVSKSEDKMTDIPPSESWELRKEITIATLQTASLDEKILVLSDKLSNIRTMNRDYTLVGDKLWDRFNQKDKTCTVGIIVR
jgi:(p)ppGpp synthase/HD superfamily hydrolase